MSAQTPPTHETHFYRGSWLSLLLAIASLTYTIFNLAYRFSLPTDGWEVSEGSAALGLTYTNNMLGNTSTLKPGDRVIALEGIPANWNIIEDSSNLKQIWRVGKTIEYTVVREGTEIQIPVTLMNWQIGKWLTVNLQDPVKLMGLLSGMILLLLAVFVFFRRPGNLAAGAFLIVMTVLASMQLSETLPFGFPTWIDPVANFMQSRINWILLLVLLPFALIRFALVFPQPKPVHRRYPWLSTVAGVIGLVLVIFFPDNPISWFWFVFSLLLSVAILIHNALTMRDSVSRAQMRWGLGGFIIGFGTLALMFLVGTLGLLEFHPEYFSLVFVFATTVMGCMLAVAILRYRLFDIDVIIRRTLIYGSLTLALILVYFGAVVILQNVFEVISGQKSALAIVISTLVIAALFNPLRRRIQRLIDHRFYRRKYDAEKILTTFSANLRAEVDLDALYQQVQMVIEETVQPEYISLWLKI